MLLPPTFDVDKTSRQFGLSCVQSLLMLSEFLLTTLAGLNAFGERLLLSIKRLSFLLKSLMRRFDRRTRLLQLRSFTFQSRPLSFDLSSFFIHLSLLLIDGFSLVIQLFLAGANLFEAGEPLGQLFFLDGDRLLTFGQLRFASGEIPTLGDEGRLARRQGLRLLGNGPFSGGHFRIPTIQLYLERCEGTLSLFNVTASSFQIGQLRPGGLDCRSGLFQFCPLLNERRSRSFRLFGSFLNLPPLSAPCLALSGEFATVLRQPFTLLIQRLTLGVNRFLLLMNGATRVLQLRPIDFIVFLRRRALEFPRRGLLQPRFHFRIAFAQLAFLLGDREFPLVQRLGVRTQLGSEILRFLQPRISRATEALHLRFETPAFLRPTMRVRFQLLKS